jgi:hypothetical protein
MFANEPSQSMDRCKALVACRNAAVPIALNVCEELAHQFRAHIHNPQAID